MNQLKPRTDLLSQLTGTFPRSYEHGPIEALIIFAVALLIGYVVYRIVLRGAVRIAAHGNSGLQVKVVDALRLPLAMWILLIALLAGLRDFDFTTVPTLLRELLTYLLLGLIVISFTMAASRMTILVLNTFLAKRGQPTTTLTETLVRLVWVIPGIMLVMNFFGIALAPILTALGVGGLAVALGLRDTLSNLFAGFYVILAGQFDQGDYVRLSTGEEGYVADIRWRITSLRTLNNHWILIPNSKIAEAIVTNFSKPDRLTPIGVPVRVHLATEIETVEKLLLEAAAEVAAVNPNLLLKPAPSVSFTSGFIESGLEMTLNVTVSEYQSQYKVLDQLRRAILRRFRSAGVEFAMPIRRVVSDIPSTKSQEPPPSVQS